GRTHYAMVLLADFVKDPRWQSVKVDAWQAALVAGELDELHTLIEFRPAVLREALNQRGGFGAYFQGERGASNATQPSLAYLIEGAMRIASFQVMYHKNRFQRPRPSQLSRSLLPEVEVPSHAAYPSGHATQAWTIAYVLDEVLRRAAAASPSP